MMTVKKLSEIIVGKRKVFYFISLFIIFVSFFSLIFIKPKLSIEFTGGALLDTSCNTCNVSAQELEKMLDFAEAKVNRSQSGYLIKIPSSNLDKLPKVKEIIKKNNLKIESQTMIGPSIGEQMKKKAIFAIVFVSIAIVIFISVAFYEVSKPVSSFYYGLVAIVALLHDVIVPTGLYTLMGGKIDTLFVVAALAILGYSVNDTIVIFDRLREMLKINTEKKIKEPFEKTVAKAIEYSFARSVNTSVTTAIVLAVLYFLGPEVTKFFALYLLLGVVAGTYSSIFLAAPMLISIYKFKNRGSKNK